MGAHRVDAVPLLDEHQPVGVFDIDMAIMRQTPRLGTRPRAMFGTERDHAFAMLGSEDDVAGDEDHNPSFEENIFMLKAHLRKFFAFMRVYQDDPVFFGLEFSGNSQ